MGKRGKLGARGRLRWPPQWPLLKPVDYFALAAGREAWIAHESPCPRTWTSDGLCECINPTIIMMTRPEAAKARQG